MKLKTIILFLTINFLAYSQTDCEHNVSTNPTSHSNDALPVNSTGQDTRYLNNFDWFPIGAVGTPEEGLYLGYPLSNMNFAGTPITSMSSIMSAQGTSPYYSYIYNGALPLTENGWELLLVNVGRFPDNTTDIPLLTTDLKAFPYIVIYNRYMGIVRVFCMFGLDRTVFDAADAVEITLEYVDDLNYSGLMRLYEGVDQALDVKTDVKRMSSITKAENYGNKWYSTDFQIAYDPCQCYYPSQLRLKFAQIKVTDIKAHSRTITLEDQELVNNTNLTVNPSDWLSGFDYTGETAEGGVAMAKSMKIMTTRYIAELEAYKIELEAAQIHNAEVERKLVIMKLFEKVVLEGGSSAVTSLMGMPWWGKLNEFAKDLIGKDVIDEKSIKEEAKKAMALGVKSLKTMIAGEIRPLPTKPEIPTATFSETSYSGQTTQRSNYTGPLFYNPGTYGSVGTGTPLITSVHSYPVYNEILGTFALLESPKLRIKELNHSIVDKLLQKTFHNPSTAVWDLNIERYQSWTKSYQIELVEDLKYAFNSVLDIKNYSIKASYAIVAKTKNSTIPNNVMQNAFQDAQSNTNFVFTNEEASDNSPIVSRTKPFNFYNTNPDFDWTHWTQIESPTITKSQFEMQTPFLPIEAFKPFEAKIGIKNEAIGFKRNWITDNEIDDYVYTTTYPSPGVSEINFDLNDTDVLKPAKVNVLDYNYGYGYDFEIELKLLVDIEYKSINSNGTTNKSTQILTYKIDPVNINHTQFDVDLVNPINNISVFPENLNLIDINFNGAPVNGCWISGDTYTCKAWNTINIEGNLTTSNGYKVLVKAGNQIIEKNNSTVSPEIILSIEPVLDFSDPMPQATLAEVTSFCNGANPNSPSYQAKFASRKVQAAVAAEKARNLLEQKRDDFNWDFNLYPNPTNKLTNIELAGNYDSEIQIQLLDIAGKKVYQSHLINENQLSIDISNLNKGLYFVKINSKGVAKTKQLIIQ